MYSLAVSDSSLVSNMADSTNLEAVLNYKQMFRQIGRFGGVVGVNMVQSNYRPTLRTILMLSLNISLVCSSLYTMIFYDSKAAWLASNNLGMTLQAYNNTI